MILRVPEFALAPDDGEELQAASSAQPSRAEVRAPAAQVRRDGPDLGKFLTTDERNMTEDYV
jgi:hypothetical protein